MGWKPKPATADIIAAASNVVEAAAKQGYVFTLRRVYYKLVARNIIPNTKRSYKNLSSILDKARWAGYLRPDALEDIERPVLTLPSWRGREEFLRSCISQYRTDWWRDADHKVEVWAEKRAVTSILAPVAHRYGVPFLAMRGFGSFTAIHEASQRFRGHSTTIIYVGDLDPSGVEMDKDIRSRLARMYVDVTVQRVALTRTQVDVYDIMPQPTKLSDSRAARWPHPGSWELDALDEAVLVNLVEGAVECLLPDDFDERRKADRDVRATMREQNNIVTNAG